MSHRGPDSEGVHSEGPITLAFRRLAILDPTPAGHQPMSNTDGSVWIVFNGEIYNYKELRERVSEYNFKSETDTEVLLALYDKYGTDCLEMLRGMFAFAIWDTNAEELFLARDRLGQKPLFYHHDETGFRFGSTIKAILADENITATPDLDAIRSFLTYQYIPHPKTGFEGIRRVSPGESMVVSEDGIERDQYWSISHTSQSTASISSLAGQLRDKLTEATQLRMRSDVPIGVFLSGGIDSSIVTALMSEQTDKAVKTYSIGFNEYDEFEHARAVANRYHTDHHEYTVTPDALEILPQLVSHYEMPFGDPSALPTYYVSKVASEDITVAVGGDAGDENFAGYDRYLYDQLTNIASQFPQQLRHFGRYMLNEVPKKSPGATIAQRGENLLQTAEKDAVERYAEYICHIYGDDAKRIWDGDEPKDEFVYLRDAFADADGVTRLDKIMNVDLRTYLPDDLLLKVDRASMAHSLEVRSPFLDHELVEFAAQIPSKYKLRRGKKKWILKKAFSEYLPEKVQKRSKQGFSVPVDKWFRNELKNFARTQLSRLGDRSAFDASGIQSTLDSHLNRTADNGHHIWDLVVLEMWFEQFID